MTRDDAGGGEAEPAERLAAAPAEGTPEPRTKRPPAIAVERAGDLFQADRACDD